MFSGVACDTTDPSHATGLNTGDATGLNMENATGPNVGDATEAEARDGVGLSKDVVGLNKDGMDTDAPPTIPAGWPEEAGGGCVRFDPAAVLRATPRSFALRVCGYSMVGAGIYDGDVVVGEFTPEARPGAIVVALIDGESTLKRWVVHDGRPHLVSENPNCPDFIPLSELVIQGVIHTVVKRV